MFSKNDTLPRLREIIPTLYDDYAIKRIGLLESFSYNTFNEDSDIDILYQSNIHIYQLQANNYQNSIIAIKIIININVTINYITDSTIELYP